MVAIGTKEIQIEKAFEKGFVQDKGSNKIPQYFSGYLRNARISNGATTIRKGNREIVSPAISGPVQGMVYIDQLYFVSGGLLCTLFGVIGNIGYTGPVNFIKYGPIIIILTGVGNPRVFDSSTFLFFQVQDSSMPFDLDPLVPLDCPLKPYIGDSFTGFTFFAGNATGYKNVLYISQPVVVDRTTNQPQYASAYSWNSVLPVPNNGAENRVMTSDILGIKANLNNLYIFCQDTIEILGRSSATNVGGIVSLYTQPIADGDQVMNNDCIVSAGERIFYLTNSLKVKTIGFVPGITDPEVGELSDRIYQSIEGFLGQIDPTSGDTAFGIYSKNDSTIRWHLRTFGSSVNDICLIYDMVNDCFLVDTNKNYSCMTSGFSGQESTMYAGSALDVKIYEDDYLGLDETGTPGIPPFERNSPNIHFGSPNRLKQFRGFTIAGGINQYTTLTFNIYIDGTLKLTKNASYADITDPEAVNIGGPNIVSGFALYPFEFAFDEGQLRAKGKKIRLQITASVQPGFGPGFYLDSLSFFVRPLVPYELGDKI